MKKGIAGGSYGKGMERMGKGEVDGGGRELKGKGRRVLLTERRLMVCGAVGWQCTSVLASRCPRRLNYHPAVTFSEVQHAV